MKRFFLAAAAAMSIAAPASAQENYLGQILLVGYSFCPRGTAPAEGQLLPIEQNTALFSLYGTQFGGDGRVTFGLPDLRGRAPMGQGHGPGLTARSVGQKVGAETVTQTTNQMPAHTHGVTVTSNAAAIPANEPTAIGNVPALSTIGNIYTNSAGTTAPMAPQANTVTQNSVGGGQAMNIMQPSIAMRYCVVLLGTYPSRN